MSLFSPDDLNAAFPEATPDALQDPNAASYEAMADAFVASEEAAGRLALTGGHHDAIGDLMAEPEEEIVNEPDPNDPTSDWISQDWGPGDDPNPTIEFGADEGLDEARKQVGYNSDASRERALQTLSATERTDETNILHDSILRQQVDILVGYNSDASRERAMKYLNEHRFRTMDAAVSASELYDQIIETQLGIYIGYNSDASRERALTYIDSTPPRLGSTVERFKDTHDDILVNQADTYFGYNSDASRERTLKYLDEHQPRTQSGKTRMDELYDRTIVAQIETYKGYGSAASRERALAYIQSVTPRTSAGLSKVQTLQAEIEAQL